MIHKYLITGLLLAALTAVGQAEDKPKLPEGPPPRLVNVVEVKGDLVVYRDFYLMMPLLPKKPGHSSAALLMWQLNRNELIPSHPLAGPSMGCAVEFSLKEGEVFDAEGNKLTGEAAKKRLAVGDIVLVSTYGRKVDSAYLRIVKKETLILVHPPPRPPLAPPPP
jgi:hypothetical protein